MLIDIQKELTAICQLNSINHYEFTIWFDGERKTTEHAKDAVKRIKMYYPVTQDQATQIVIDAYNTYKMELLQEITQAVAKLSDTFKNPDLGFPEND